LTDDEARAEVDVALLSAQSQGKVLLAEMIAVLDEEIAMRCASARGWAKVDPQWRTGAPVWGRKTLVLEKILLLLTRISNDEQAQDVLRELLRAKGAKGGSVDRGGDRGTEEPRGRVPGDDDRRDDAAVVWGDRWEDMEARPQRDRNFAAPAD
jgi:hypothetical protein